MPLYYYIALDCEPRRQLGAEELVGLVQDDVLARRLADEFRKAKGDDYPDSEMIFTRRHIAADGAQESRDLSVADLKRGTEQLRALAPHCRECPAALGGADYGCVQSISFPITQAAEQWLLARIGPATTDCGRLFRASVVQMGYGRCEMLEEWRDVGFLESPEPLTRTEPGDPVLLSSDQILHAMLMSGDLSPVQALSLLLFTQALALTDGGDTDAVLELIQAIQSGQAEGATPELVFLPMPGPEDEPSLFELKTFLYAAFRAFSLGCALAVRPGAAGAH